MSFQAMTWAVEQELPALQKLVLLMLANCSNHHTGQCNPSHERLAKECGMSRDSVKRAIAELSEKGLLEIHRKTKDGVNLPNQYVLRVGSSVGGVGADSTEGRVSQHRGVGADSTTKQEVETGNETEEEKALAELDAALAENPAPLPVELIPTSRGASISLLMRKAGVGGCNASNPVVIDWASNPKVTDDLLLTAASMAKAREVSRPGPNYLDPIVKQLLNPPKQKPPRDDWYRSDAGISRKAAELGVYARPGDSFAQLRERCESELRKREGVAA